MEQRRATVFVAALRPRGTGSKVSKRGSKSINGIDRLVVSWQNDTSRLENVDIAVQSPIN